jgi:hypothetical protein
MRGSGLSQEARRQLQEVAVALELVVEGAFSGGVERLRKV